MVFMHKTLIRYEKFPNLSQIPGEVLNPESKVETFDLYPNILKPKIFVSVNCAGYPTNPDSLSTPAILADCVFTRRRPS